MSDWKYGDVLVLRREGGHHSLAMFVARPDPLVLKADGSVKSWGFRGVSLGYLDCAGCPGYDHGLGVQGLGGHPDVSWGGRGWELFE